MKCVRTPRPSEGKRIVHGHVEMLGQSMELVLSHLKSRLAFGTCSKLGLNPMEMALLGYSRRFPGGWNKSIFKVPSNPDHLGLVL